MGVAEHGEKNQAKGLGKQVEGKVNEVAGGDGSCTSSITIGTSGVTVSGPTSGLGQALIDTYEGVVDVTSHVIERVAN